MDRLCTSGNIIKFEYFHNYYNTLVVDTISILAYLIIYKAG